MKETKIKRSTYAILDVLLVATSPVFFRPFHQGVRECYRRILVPLLAKRLQKKLPLHKVALVPRQSFQSGKGFNAFASDLDLAVVFSSQAGQPEFALAREILAAAKNRIPSLGEIEIYLETEWARRHELEDQYGDWLATLRDLRKIKWMERAHQEAPTRYHRRKSLRSLAQCNRRLGTTSERVKRIEAHFGKRLLLQIGKQLDARSIDEYSFFLERRIAGKESETGQIDSQAMTLSLATAAALLSSLPSHAWPDRAPYERWAARLRRNHPELRTWFRAVTEWDLLNLNAYVRGLSRQEEWMIQVPASVVRDLREN